MNLIKVLGYYLISVFNLIVLLMSYNKLTKAKTKINIKSIVVILLGSLVFTINFYFSDPLNKLLINFLVVYFTDLLLGKDNNSVTLIGTVIMYLILFVIEILTSSLVMLTNVVDMNMFNSNIWLKALLTIIDSGLLYLICSRKPVINFVNKILKKIRDNSLLIAIAILSVIILLISDIRFFNTFSYEIYLSNFIMLIILLAILILTIITSIKTFKETQKTEALLSFMTKYEKTIDKDRVNKHELLNELLILKSVEDKNTNEFKEMLNELIDKFTNKGIKIKNIYNLPSGLKGILYYKLYGLDEKGYDININVSKVAIKSLKQISSEDYASLYKIVGIVIDNAIEASNNTNKKYILIDIYGEDEIIVEISNSFKGKIDLNRLGEKYYSSKGKKRGLGLYIINRILRNSDIIFEQSINGKIFTTKITIKK